MLSNASVYNSLLDVVEADEQLIARGKTDALQALADVILRHRMEQRIGVRLLHRHNELAPREVMVEREETSAAGDRCLTTAVEQAPSQCGRLAPNSWILRHGQFVPLEFSALSHGQNFDDLDSLFDDLETVLIHHKMADLLGPWVPPTTFLKENPPRDGYVMLEETDVARHANVLRYVPRCADQTSIETTWMVARETNNVHGEIKALGTCRTVYECWSEPGNHRRTTRHT